MKYPKGPLPLRWLTTIYSVIAAGRHKMDWLPEFLVQLDRVIERDGEEAAWNWAAIELSLSLQPAAAARFLKVVRFLRLLWKIYARYAAD